MMMSLAGFSMTGCAALPEALSAIGGGVSLARAYLDYSADPVEVISRDCLLVKYVSVPTEERASLSRATMVAIAGNNKALVESCDNITRPAH